MGREQCQFIGSGERSVQKSGPHVGSRSPPDPGPADHSPIKKDLKTPASSEQTAFPERTSLCKVESMAATKGGTDLSVEREGDLLLHTEAEDSRKSLQDTSHEMEKRVKDKEVKSRAEPGEPPAGAVCREQKDLDGESAENSKTKAKAGKSRRRGKRPRDNPTDSESEEHKSQKSSKRPSKKAKTGGADPEDHPPRVTARGTENLLGEVMDEEGAVQRVTGSTARSTRYNSHYPSPCPPSMISHSHRLLAGLPKHELGTLSGSI